MGGEKSIGLIVKNLRSINRATYDLHKIKEGLSPFLTIKNIADFAAPIIRTVIIVGNSRFAAHFDNE